MLNLHGEEVKITVTKVGGKQEEMISYVYDLPLIDSIGEIVHFRVHGIDRISTEIKAISIKDVLHLFHGITGKSVRRPTGEIDVLVGFEYVGHHPVRERSVGHLLLLGNRFGKCLGGSHPLKEGTKKLIQHVSINHIRHVSVEDFYNIQSVGVECSPRCCGCKCSDCPLGGQSYNLKEERELRLIEDGLKHNDDHWIAQYPWIHDPLELPDNYSATLVILKNFRNGCRKISHMHRFTRSKLKI